MIISQLLNAITNKRSFALTLNTIVLALALFVALPANAEGRAIKQRTAPVYPEIAKRMKISGLVKLEVTVSPEGKVTGVKTVSGNRMLSSAAEDAVKQWKFASGTESSTESVDINFALAQ